jgi:peptidoglycan/xylan/chitin deacetylase (PgdA/CDA1 family)
VVNAVKTAIKCLGGAAFKALFFAWGEPDNARIILTYHRVLNEVPHYPYDPAMYVTAATLKMHIQELGRSFEFVLVDDILSDGKARGRRCAITFDDGWLDNYTNALPILREYHIPATVFIPLGMIGTNRRFWFHEIWEIVRQVSGTPCEQRAIQYFAQEISEWKGQVLDVDGVCDLIDRLKHRSADHLDDVIARAYQALELQQNPTCYLVNWDQIREMGAQGIRFGSHGLYHYILPRISRDLKTNEVRGSYAMLQDLNIPISHVFCYPNSDWDTESIACVKAAGYMGAVGGSLGYVGPQSHPFVLNRIPLHNDISCTPSLLWFRLFQAHVAESSVLSVMSREP